MGGGRERSKLGNDSKGKEGEEGYSQTSAKGKNRVKKKQQIAQFETWTEGKRTQKKREREKRRLGILCENSFPLVYKQKKTPNAAQVREKKTAAPREKRNLSPKKKKTIIAQFRLPNPSRQDHQPVTNSHYPLTSPKVHRSLQHQNLRFHSLQVAEHYPHYSAHHPDPPSY